MASNIFWLVVAATLLPLVTYWLFEPLFNPPRNRTAPLEQEPGALHRAHQARPGISQFTSEKTDIACSTTEHHPVRSRERCGKRVCADANDPKKRLVKVLTPPVAHAAGAFDGAMARRGRKDAHGLQGAEIPRTSRGSSAIS